MLKVQYMDFFFRYNLSSSYTKTPLVVTICLKKMFRYRDILTVNVKVVLFFYFIGSELDTRYDLVRDFDSIVYEKRDYCYDNRGRSDGK